MEAQLVEHHMRNAVYVRRDFRSAVTTSSSEPLVAEAARRTWALWDMAGKLRDALYLTGQEEGDRGEMLAMLLLLQTYDAVRNKVDVDWTPMGLRPAVLLLDFLDCLLGSYNNLVKGMRPTFVRQPATRKPLRDAFADSKVYFTHFIRTEELGVLGRRYLPGFLNRGAAILCPFNKDGLDICIPFVYRGGSLDPSNIGLIVIQVRNNPDYGSTPQPWRLCAMNPCFNDETDEKQDSNDQTDNNEVPTIRLFFALGSSESAIIPMTESSQRSFTSYDIWCAGADGTTFAPIRESKHPESYTELIKFSQCGPTRWIDPEDGPPYIENMRRPTVPAPREMPSHWLFADDMAAALNEALAGGSIIG